MQQLVLIIHILVAAAIVGLVMIQKSSSGSGLGSAFGAGASGTLFGSQGSVSFLFKLTAGLVLVFFSTSIILGRGAMDAVKQSAAVVHSSGKKNVPSLPISDNVPIKLNRSKDKKQTGQGKKETK